MEILKRNQLNINANYKFVLKIVTCIVITWLCQYCNDENTICKSLKYGRKNDMSLGRRAHRVLARYEKQNDIRNTGLQYKAPSNDENYKIGNVRENMNTYEHLKRGSSNHMEAYLKCYKQRYTKKKGLKKLDCIYEKKLFMSLHKMEKIAAQKNTSKNSIKKLIYKKYGLPLILLSLIPTFGLILPIRYFNNFHLEDGTCMNIEETKTSGKYKGVSHRDCKFLSESYIYLNYIFIFSTIFLTIFLVTYTIIKVAKYERIKHGY